MKIVITGATGFLGSWVARILSNANYEVIAVARPSSNDFRLKQIANLQLFRASSNHEVQELIVKIRPYAVISFDWEGVKGSARNEISQFSNIERISSLARVIKSSNVNTFICFGSQAEVGPTSELISEQTLCKPTTLYGEAKMLLQMQLSEIFEKSDTRFIWGRIFSTFGPMEDSQWFTSSLINALLQEEKFPMTSGEQYWNYLHTYDFAKAVLRILENDNISGVINIAHVENKRIADIANYVAKKLNKSEYVEVGAIEYRPDQVMSLKVDISKLLAIGWEPVLSTEEGLDDLVEYLQNPKITRHYSGESFNLN